MNRRTRILALAALAAATSCNQGQQQALPLAHAPSAPAEAPVCAAAPQPRRAPLTPAKGLFNFPTTLTGAGQLAFNAAGQPDLGPSGQPAAAGDEYDFAPAKRSIAWLKAFPGAVQPVLNVVAQTNFGPFDQSGSCSYQCWIGICMKDFHWLWSFPNYTWMKSTLHTIYAQVHDTASSFDAAFAPLRGWLTTTLPQVSQQFDAATARINVASAVATAPGAPATAVAAANQDIVTAVRDLLGSLQQGDDQLQEGIASLSGYNRRLTAVLQQVGGTGAQMEQMLTTDEARMNSTVGDWPCGDGDARGAVHGIEGTVRAQYTLVTVAASSAGVLAPQSDAAVSTLLGTILNLRSRYQVVFNQLNAAQVTPAGAVQQLRLGVASAALRDLSTYARQQLQ